MGKKLEGKLNGPSHERGGIKFNLGGEIQEAEGGEYVVTKDGVNPETEGMLEYINKFHRLPGGKTFKKGGLITDARKRRK